MEGLPGLSGRARQLLLEGDTERRTAAALLRDAVPHRIGQTGDGTRYTVAGGAEAEVLAGSTRHRTVTITRVRSAETDG